MKVETKHKRRKIKAIKISKMVKNSISKESKIWQREFPSICINCGCEHYNGGSVCSDECFEEWNNKNSITK